MKKLFYVLSALALVAMIGTGCGKDVKSLKLSKSSMEIAIGQSFSVSHFAGDNDVKVMIDPSDIAYTVTSANPAIAKVEAGNKVIGVAEGETVITVSAKKKTATLTVKVTGAPAPKKDRIVNGVYFQEKTALLEQKTMIDAAMKEAGWQDLELNEDAKQKMWAYQRELPQDVLDFVVAVYMYKDGNGKADNALRLEGIQKEGTFTNLSEKEYIKKLAGISNSYGFSESLGNGKFKDGTVFIGVVNPKLGGMQAALFAFTDEYKGSKFDTFIAVCGFDLLSTQNAKQSLTLKDFAPVMIK